MNLRDKLPNVLHQIVGFFGWTDADSEDARQVRKLLAIAVFGYSIGLAKRAGFTADELEDRVAETWTKAHAPK